MKKVRVLVIALLLSAGAYLSNDAKAGCSISTPTIDTITIVGACTWGDNGNYCELIVTPWVNCSVNI